MSPVCYEYNYGIRLTQPPKENPPNAIVEQSAKYSSCQNFRPYGMCCASTTDCECHMQYRMQQQWCVSACAVFAWVSVELCVHVGFVCVFVWEAVMAKCIVYCGGCMR